VATVALHPACGWASGVKRAIAPRERPALATSRWKCRHAGESGRPGPRQAENLCRTRSTSAPEQGRPSRPKPRLTTPSRRRGRPQCRSSRLRHRQRRDLPRTGIRSTLTLRQASRLTFAADNSFLRAGRAFACCAVAGLSFRHRLQSRPAEMSSRFVPATIKGGACAGPVMPGQRCAVVARLRRPRQNGTTAAAHIPSMILPTWMLDSIRA
jgi:hypothetical protein